MTQIQASVQVVDKVDSNIETKIEQIGNASDKASVKINNLQKAISSISNSSLNTLANTVNSLSRTNLSNLSSQIQGLNSSLSGIVSGFNNGTIASVKLQTAQTKLAQEQAKLAVIQQRIQTQSAQTATAQTRNAIATANLANAQARANTSTIRTTIAQNQQSASAIRLQIATERLNNVLQRNKTITTSANSSLVGMVGSLTLAYGAVQSLIGAVSKADEYQRLINKLSLVTDTAGEARDRLSSLTTVALNSYSGLNSVTQLYTRLHLALKQTGGSASEAIAMTQTLSKATALAGLTTAEANSALLQISQAFNKGKLDGDEFRTVMETMPLLADAIAKRLGKVRGELLKLAPEGKITGQVMKEAVIDMAETVDQKFAKLTPTIEMQLQNLSTQAQVYFGSMFKDSGLAKALGGSIQYIANNLEQATRLATAFGIAMSLAGVRSAVIGVFNAITNVKTAIQGATTVMGMFNLAVTATPIGWLIAGVTTLVGLTDIVFDGAISKTIFPNFSQDKAKADDYIRQLKDINSQLDTMSSLKLSNIFTDNIEAQKEVNKQIKEYQRKLKDVEKQIAFNAEKEKEYAEAVARAGRETGLSKGLWEQHAQAIKFELGDVNALLAKRDGLLLDLENSQQSNIELQKQELAILKEQKERLDASKKALEDNKTLHNLTKEEQEKHQKVISTITGRFFDLEGSIDRVTNSLRTLLGLNADLSPTLQDSLSAVATKVDETALSKFKKIQEQNARKMKILTTKGKENDLARAEDQLASDKDQLSTVDVNGKVLSNEEIKKGAETAYQVALKTTAQTIEQGRINQENAKAEAEEERKRQKARAEAERAEKRKEEQIKRNREEYERFVGKLEDEALLLNEGFENYNKYNELYALRNKLAQKGFEINKEQMEQLKAKIDANTKLRELAKEINSVEENSLAKQRESLALKIEAIEKANVSDKDKQIAYDGMLGDMGAVYNVDTGVLAIQEQYQTYYETLDKMRLDDYQKEVAITALKRQEADALHEQRLKNMHAMGGMQHAMATAIESFENNATNSIMNVLNGTQSIGDAMRGLAVTILNDVVKAIVQMGVRWVATQATQTASAVASNSTIASSATATGTAITTAMTPAATTTAMATYGSSATMGMAAMMAGMTMIPMLLSMALSGKRMHGGSVRAGDLYQVGEGNAPEIYQSRSGRQYMIAGDDGRVINNRNAFGGGSVVHITQNVTINGNGTLDPDTLKQMQDHTRGIVLEVLVEQSRDGGISS